MPCGRVYPCDVHSVLFGGIMRVGVTCVRDMAMVVVVVVVVVYVCMVYGVCVVWCMLLFLPRTRVDRRMGTCSIRQCTET